ncbi:hypothetical protein BCR33DRAFT_721164 [Rhizoclosmatium globosum]|uniref:Uncharacterized protein n=1 Tax=Rhizoclosmatium globosum TaxID=329046 RepID=A0A1Y2BT82_9FUNG|nr:hypothetical protein BCR33DRAFT_721164 [Rhizoclosmatium globosum]|eukprot:ORY37972.1 hypothetical protein BCR33DRAFT_721164 [Rhizoclosmatium globosum]
MVACDTVATPFLAVLLHKDLVSRQGIMDAIRKGRMSMSTTPNSTIQRCTGENTSMYISTLKEVEAAAINSIERSKSVARTSRHFSLGATL